MITVDGSVLIIDDIPHKSGQIMINISHGHINQWRVEVPYISHYYYRGVDNYRVVVATSSSSVSNKLNIPTIAQYTRKYKIENLL